MNDLVWTREKPTAPGFWFYRLSPPQGRTQVAELAYLPITCGEKLMVHFANGYSQRLDNFQEQSIDALNGEWSGPIPLPREAT